MSVYDIITARVVALLEQGTVPWHKPWRGGAAGHPRNQRSGKPYRGINVFLLATAGYSSRELRGQVRKGEHGLPVIFWSWIVCRTLVGRARTSIMRVR